MQDPFHRWAAKNLISPTLNVKHMSIITKLMIEMHNEIQHPEIPNKYVFSHLRMLELQRFNTQTIAFLFYLPLLYMTNKLCLYISNLAEFLQH